MAPARLGRKKSPKVWSRAQTTVNLERAWISPNRKRIEESDEDDGEKTERNNKVLQNKKPTEECTANTLVVDGKKARKKRDAREPAEVHKKKQKVSACK